MAAEVPAPTGVHASGAATYTTVQWDKVADAVSYAVTAFRNGAALPQKTTVPQPPTFAVYATFHLTGDCGDYGLCGSEAARFRFEVVAQTDCLDSSPVSTSTVIVGHPAPPTGAAITNSGTTSSNVVLQFDAPTVDVAGGYYLRLKYWSRGATSVGDSNVLPVATAPGGSDALMVRRSSPQLSTSPPGAAGKWQLTVPRTGLFCGSDLCGSGGKFSLVEFGALSWFLPSGAPADPSWTQALRVPQQLPPLPVAGAFAYYGERQAAGGLLGLAPGAGLHCMH